MHILYLTHHQIHWILTLVGVVSAVLGGYSIASHNTTSLVIGIAFGLIGGYCFGSILAEYKFIDPFYDNFDDSFEEPQQERDT